MEEARRETFTWKYLKENFIKDFKFVPHDESLVEASNQVKIFLQPTSVDVPAEEH